MATYQQQSQQLLSDQSWVEDKLSGSISYRMEVSSGPPLVQTCGSHTKCQSGATSLFTKSNSVVKYRSQYICSNTEIQLTHSNDVHKSSYVCCIIELFYRFIL